MTNEKQNALTLYLRVRYGECDAQNVVFNARYADYADIAATEYMRALIGDYEELQAAGFDNQVVSLKIDWKRPAKFDDVLALRVQTTHIGNTSFQFTVSCSKREVGEWIDVAQMQVTYVMVSLPDYEKCSVPEMFRANLQRPFDIVVNQAGEFI